MTSLSLYTKLENLSPELKKEAKRFIEKLLDSQKKEKNGHKKSTLKKRAFGSLQNKIHLSEDFDAPLDEFNEYM